MAGVVTVPKNVIPTVVYLRGNEVSRIPHRGTTKYKVATDEQIQSIINSFTPGGEGDVTYDVATDEQIQDIIDDYPNDNENPDNNDDTPDDDEQGEEPEETNSEANENGEQEEPEYVVASDDDILDIINEFDNNGHTEGHI